MKLVQVQQDTYVNSDHIETVRKASSMDGGFWLGMNSGESVYVEPMYAGNIWSLITPGS